MDTYVYRVTTRSTSDFLQTHAKLKDAISLIQEENGVEAAAYAVTASFDYLVVVLLPSRVAAMKAAGDLTVGGDAEVEVMPAMSLDEYDGIAVTRGNKKS